MPDENSQVRAAIFHHLAGIVLVPTLRALSDRGVFQLFSSPSTEVTVEDVQQLTHGNRGYLAVALRLLASYGWLRQKREPGRALRYLLTEEGRAAQEFAPLYGEVISFIPKALFLEDFLFGTSDEAVLPSLQALVRRAQERWGLRPSENPLHQRIARHLDGMLLGPAMVALAREGVFANLPELKGNPGSLNAILDLLILQGWAVREGGRVRLTSAGEYAASIATSYGVTVSYLPMFDVLTTLLFGNPNMPRVDETGVELLVNRGMNVWGSGGAHKTYFKKNEEIITEIFNRPLERQPQGICDMGCGDATLLIHLYEVVRDRTLRGKHLRTHPLTIVGADFNKAARRISKQNLKKAGVSTSHVIHGDICRPALLASDLEGLGLDIHALLHVRSFLDHNRPYLPPRDYVRGNRKAKTTGAFAQLGEEIPADEMEENLVRHLRRWAPYVGIHGLLALELHTLPPELTAENLDRTLAVAYDGTHGFSDQYLVEREVFLEAAREAGLKADERFSARFPASELATVSITFFNC